VHIAITDESAGAAQSRLVSRRFCVPSGNQRVTEQAVAICNSLATVQKLALSVTRIHGARGHHGGDGAEQPARFSAVNLVLQIATLDRGGVVTTLNEHPKKI
jgi:hypothetical protein